MAGKLWMCSEADYSLGDGFSDGLISQWSTSGDPGIAILTNLMTTIERGALGHRRTMFDQQTVTKSIRSASAFRDYLYRPKSPLALLN